MKTVLFLLMVFAMASFALQGDFNWQSFSGAPNTQYSMNLVESESNQMTVNVSIPGFWLGNTVAGGNTWDAIELPGVFTQTDVGLPEVPNIGQMFALPFGTTATITVTDVNYTTYSNINLVPVQTPEIDMPHTPFAFRQDGNAYATNDFFPANWAEAVAPGTWGGINSDKLLVNPFRYNPVTKELQVAESMTIQVNFEGAAEMIAYPSTETVRNSASRMLINYDLVRQAASVETDAEAAEYIFITTSANHDAILPLVEFYQGVGYETSVEVLPTGSSAGVIKAAMADHYDTAITRFALIAGDHAALPSYNYGSFVGDFYYACLVGTDLTPEIAVGRLTGDATQIETQVTKIIEGYYQYNFADGNTTGIIPSTSVLAAHAEEYPGKYTQCCNEIAAATYAIDMNFWKIFPPEGGTNAMVSDWFNNGVGSVGYRGHGSESAWVWSAPGSWSKTNIQALTNTFLPPTWNIDCLNGRYQDTGECLAESFAWDDNGASGNLSANDPSYTTPNHDYMKQLYLNLYNEGVYNVAEAINNSAVWIIVNHGSSGETNAKMYMWFGDPVMEIFTNDVANPTPLEISCNPGMVNPGSQTITMTVTNLGSPIAGATVALSDGIDGVETNTFFETTTTNSSGQASFSVNVPAGATTLYTGARLHNYNPTATTLAVYPTSIDESYEGVETFTLGVNITENPIQGTAALNFSTPATGHASVQVFDLTGRTVSTLVNEEVSAGNHSISWTPENISSGVYFVRLTTPSGTVSTQAMVLR